jgi:hypothetical protein
VISFNLALFTGFKNYLRETSTLGAKSPNKCQFKVVSYITNLNKMITKSSPLVCPLPFPPLVLPLPVLSIPDFSFPEFSVPGILSSSKLLDE